jgi:hypothetical protein
MLLLPKVPCLIFAVLAILGGILGLTLRSDFGAVLAGLAWPIAIFLGANLMVFAAFCAPIACFMTTAVVTEQACDEYEAFHRAFSYTFQRKWMLLAHLAGAAVLGTVGAFISDVVTDLTLRFAGWLVGVGVGPERWREILETGNDSAPLLGARIIHFFEWLAALMTDGFRYAFFFSTGAALYLRMRLEIDETEVDEIYEPSQLPDVAPDPLRQQLDELSSGGKKES